MEIKTILKKLPDQPGIYLYYNAQGELVYVGKATSLKDRVRSYFARPGSSRPIEQMLHLVTDIKWQTTDSVLEAVILEAVYIKKYLPVYNVMGKDNKSWNYITVSTDVYPVVDTLRQHDLVRLQQRTGKTVPPQFAEIFGPYPGLNMREALKILRRLFWFSTCQTIKHSKKNPAGRPCFYYQIGQCLGVCTGEITPAAYKRRVIRPFMMFLRGNKQALIKEIEANMKRAAKAEKFEEASRLRDQLKSLLRIHDVALLNKDFFAYPEAAAPGVNDLVVTRIEGYDISNLGASGKVASMVVFDPTGPMKSEYRKFHIKTVVGQSDVDSLDEVIRRRLRHTEWSMPEVFLIDGGPPQVNRVVSVLQSLGVNIPVVGIAKGPERKRNDFFLGNKDRAFVRWVSEHQELLIRVRDEAHRFAITFQRTTRKLPKPRG